VLKLYQDREFIGQRPVVRFEGEIGQDAGGLTNTYSHVFGMSLLSSILLERGVLHHTYQSIA